MRRRPGVSGLARQRKAKEKYEKKGRELESVQLEHVEKQLAAFEENLTAFAQKHRAQINNNPVFRRQFHQMCVRVGVDPLASHKGFWAKTLGMGDFYFELGVQTVETCLETRPQNGGMLDLAELVRLLRERRGARAQRIGPHDVKYAIRKLQCLGNGFRVIRVGRRKMVLSVPAELSTDHALLLEHAEVDAHITAGQARRELGWTEMRFRAVLDVLLREGMAWLDLVDGESVYWFPSLFYGRAAAAERAAVADLAAAARHTPAPGDGDDGAGDDDDVDDDDEDDDDEVDKLPEAEDA